MTSRVYTREDVEQGRLENEEARRAPDIGVFPAVRRKHLRPVARTNLPDKFVGMNKWEQQRAKELDALKATGRIANWWGGKASGITLQLAFDTRYTPDFLVQENDGRMRLEEVKGFWRDDAKVKTRLCAALYPFPIQVLTRAKGGGGWTITPIYPNEETP